jgi:hypothetical protein
MVQEGLRALSVLTVVTMMKVQLENGLRGLEACQVNVRRFRAVMRCREMCSAILLNRGKDLRVVRLILIFSAVTGMTCQLASFTPTLRAFRGHPGGGAVPNAPEIPAGYILPVQLDRTLSIQDARAGDAINVRIVQEVPLPNREKIAFRSVVKGSVLRVARDEDETGVELTVRFDVVSHRGQNLSVVTSLRAIASYIAVREAEKPLGAFDEAFPPSWATTVQIGGDIRYGDGDTVRNRRDETVGKAVQGGVLVYAKANQALGCDEPADTDDRPQALWLFSADACGIYGLKDVQLIHNGQSEPVGEIILHFKKADMKLRAGTGMLLRVVSWP